MKKNVLLLISFCLAALLCNTAFAQGTGPWSSDLNVIKNWNFDTNTTNWTSGWVDNGVAGAVAPVITDGVAVLKVGKASDGANWHYQFAQAPLNAEANVAYTFKFKSWLQPVQTLVPLTLKVVPTLNQFKGETKSGVSANPPNL